MIDLAQDSSEPSFHSAKAFFDNSACAVPRRRTLAHLAVLSLANAGAIELALEKFSELGLAECGDPEAGALLARLNKDLGFATCGPARLAFHAEARAIYEEIYEQATLRGDSRSAYYPGINAAALAVWCGDPASARQLATQVLELLAELEQADDEGDRYWRRATAVEAHLILGQLAEVESLAGSLRELGRHQPAQIASTERQLRRLAHALGTGEHSFRGLRLPAVMHYTGHIISAPGAPGRFPAADEAAVTQQIQELLADQDVGVGYGSLAAGADILFAEALIARGAALHVILPFAIEDFLRHSVAGAGEVWVPRFHACLESAHSVRYATEDRYLNHEALFQYCSQLAMGLAILAARHMQAPVLQCAVWDGVAQGGRAGTVVDMQAWRRTGQPQHILRCGVRRREELEQFAAADSSTGTTVGRSVRALLFGDVHGFSKLTDRELPLFAETIMGALAEVVRSHRAQTSFINTWGDGIFAVFEDVRAAAEWALEAQERIEAIDLLQAGLPGHLHLRLGGHLGPVYPIMDPVLERVNYYGAHVSRAARIEPVTPEGCVYVTETFAAALALRDPDGFACDYVGYTEMAKHYGRLRIFLLRRICGGEAGPAVLGDIERKALV
jgi:class 3 adenylate cyclase